MNFTKELNFIKKHNLKTPVMFYSEVLAERPSLLIKDHLKECDIYFATKSCYNVPLLRFFVSQNFGAEVMSEFEYNLAKLAKFKRIIVNGLGRPEKFIRKVLKDKSSTFIIDTDRDLDIVKDYLSRNPQKEVSLGIRVRFNVTQDKKKKNHYLDPLNKLGNYDDSMTYHKFIDLVHTEKRVKWDIIHSHFTINEVNPSVYINMLKRIKKHLSFIDKRYGISPNRIDVGGGFEVYSEKVSKSLKRLFEKLSIFFQMNFPQKRLVVEPGRFLSAYAGYVIGKVIDIKHVKNKSWLITNIGTNVLIPNSNARYCLLLPVEVEKGKMVGITDGITSGTNNVIETAYITSLPNIDDYLVIGGVGGYTDVFSTFWGYAPFTTCNYLKSGQIKITRDKKDIDHLSSIFFKK
jgi:diaminopimelate decarboxylase